MNRKIIPSFEIGQRVYHAILVICLMIIIIAISSLAGYAIYKATTETNTSKEDISLNPKEDKIYNITAILSPEKLEKRGISKAVIEQKRAICNDYIRKHMPLAKREEELYGIPAKITMAQALLESDAGGSRLAKQNNNHFGIKCFSRKCEKSHCSNHSDDSHKDFFRKYKTVGDSYRDHSIFLMKERYKHLLVLPKDDLQGWAVGLQKAGYATDKRYAIKLLNLM